MPTLQGSCQGQGRRRWLRQQKAPCGLAGDERKGLARMHCAGSCGMLLPTLNKHAHACTHGMHTAQPCRQLESVPTAPPDGCQRSRKHRQQLVLKEACA